MMRLLMVQPMAWDSRHTWQTLDLTCLCKISVTVKWQKQSRPAEDWDDKHAACGLRCESLHHISQYRIQKVKTTQNLADIVTKAASRETLERHRKMIGLRHVEAHRSQKELRL